MKQDLEHLRMIDHIAGCASRRSSKVAKTNMKTHGRVIMKLLTEHLQVIAEDHWVPKLVKNGQCILLESSGGKNNLHGTACTVVRAAHFDAIHDLE
eukprot:572575-Amphidinium_carterae.1